MKKSFTIAGGGIGGLVTALCLHKNGHVVRVYESVNELKPLGVGINLLPHAIRILDYLGLVPELEKIGIKTSNLVYANRLGQIFLSDPRGTFAGYKWPQFSIHRGLLQQMLYRQCVATLGSDKIILGHHLESFSQTQDVITAVFTQNNDTKKRVKVDSDVLIGADGIHSVSRAQCYPEEGKVIFSGNILYRGTSLMPPFLNGSTMAMIGSNQQKMVIYPIGLPHPTTGLQHINWVANLKAEAHENGGIQDWNKEVEKTFLLEKYKAWRYDWLDVYEMINRAASLYEFPMSDRNPLQKWSFGRFSLLGDAAHPMYPIGSNGASQAILDAASLTEAFRRETTVEQALKVYEENRLPATSKIVIQNRKKGPDAILDLMENRFPTGFSAEEIPHSEIDATMSNYKKTAGFDIQTLNQKTASLEE